MKEELENRERDPETGKFLSSALPKIRIERYREHLDTVRSRHTVSLYVTAAKKFEKFLDVQGIMLKDIHSGILENFVTYLVKKRKLMPASVRASVIGTRNYIDWCISQEEIAERKITNPAVPKVESSENKVLSANELARYFNGMKFVGEPSKTALTLLPFCGLRSEEICGIKLDKKQIVEHMDGDGSVYTCFDIIGKGRKHRIVPLLPQGTQILVEYLNGWRRTIDSPWLFPGRAGLFLSPRTLRHNLNELRDLIEVKDVTPHTLRRTYLTNLSKAGVDPFIIAKIAGHTNIQTTYDHYIHSSTEDVLTSLSKTQKGESNG